VLALTLTSLIRAADQPLIERGHQVFNHWCVDCHGGGIGLEGIPQLPGTLALSTKYMGTRPALLEERTDLSPGFVKQMVRTGITIMPFFRKTEINDPDLDALAAYLSRNLQQ
jgi:mono/diheme cytochrome c family protein